MKPHRPFDKPSETPSDRFRTPGRPSPSGTARPSGSTTSKRTASPNLPASTPPWKRSSLSNVQAQSTLTQIDFVTQSTAHADDDELDYLEEAGTRQNTHTMNGSVHDDGSDDDTDYRPPTRSRPTLTKFEKNDDHPKRRRKTAGIECRASERRQSVRKSQAPKSSVGGRGKRKSTEKSAVKRDKTLTQMDFVRRYITIDDDDDNDVNMGYIQPDFQQTPAIDGHKAPASERQNARPAPPTPPKQNRRSLEAELDLSTGEPLSGTGDTQNTTMGDVSPDPEPNPPITPQKNRKLEIPSSQSPESPGLAIITSSQFRSATRSPLKQKPSNIAHEFGNAIKEESPGPPHVVGDSQGHDESLQTTPMRTSPKVLKSTEKHSSPPAATPALCASSTKPSSQAAPSEDTESRTQRTQRERTVVYETDAESDHSDGDYDTENDLATPTQARLQQSRNSRISQQSPEPSVDDSQELPLPHVQPSPHTDSGPPSEAPMSDASIYYQRKQPATQFPHEPIPTLNTQKLSELFPNEGSTRYPNTAVAVPPPKLTGHLSESQTQSQEADQTEIVPESSPIREQAHSMEEQQHAVFQRPRAPESVVQVESSQPVDRENHRLLSRSQLLTSSVMESVPLPQFWMGSQDSVGEPYSLPER